MLHNLVHRLTHWRANRAALRTNRAREAAEDEYWLALLRDMNAEARRAAQATYAHGKALERRDAAR